MQDKDNFNDFDNDMEISNFEDKGIQPKTIKFGRPSHLLKGEDKLLNQIHKQQDKPKMPKQRLDVLNLVRDRMKKKYPN